MSDNVYRLPVAEPPIGIRITWASDLQEREGPADDIVEGAIPKRVATLFAGPAGYGKTYLSQLLQTATAVDRDWIGLRTRRCRSLGLYSEDPGDKLAERQRKICTYYGIDKEDLTEWAAMVPNDDQDFILFSCGYWRFREGHPRPLWDQIEQRCKEDGIELLILDNARNVFQGERNNETHVNSFMRFLNSKAREMDCAIVVVCNPPKDKSSYFSGSQVWEDSARNTLSLGASGDEGDRQFVLQVRKSNYLPYNHPLKRRGITLEWENDVLTRIDDGEPAPLGQLGRVELDRHMVESIEFAIDKLRHKFAASPQSKQYLPSVLSRQKSWQHVSWADISSAYERLLGTGRLITVAVDGVWLVRTPHSQPYLGESVGIN